MTNMSRLRKNLTQNKFKLISEIVISLYSFIFNKVKTNIVFEPENIDYILRIVVKDLYEEIYSLPLSVEKKWNPITKFPRISLSLNMNLDRNWQFTYFQYYGYCLEFKFNRNMSKVYSPIIVNIQNLSVAMTSFKLLIGIANNHFPTTIVRDYDSKFKLKDTEFIISYLIVWNEFVKDHLIGLNIDAKNEFISRYKLLTKTTTSLYNCANNIRLLL